MTDLNNIPGTENTVAAPSFPTLTLEPQQTAALNETSDQLHAMATQVAEAPWSTPACRLQPRLCRRLTPPC
jgi:hypothetical protein